MEHCRNKEEVEYCIEEGENNDIERIAVDEESFISKDITREIEYTVSKTDAEVNEFNTIDRSEHNESSEEALHYIAGFVASKLKLKYPKLIAENERTEKKWINLKSYGHLYIPSKDLFHKLAILEKEFCSFHGDTIDTSPQPIERLTKKVICENPEIPPEVAQLFIKIRFFHRIKFLNNKREGSLRIRNIKQKTQFMY